MKAVILVGGEGTRLRPITYEIPKPLLTVKKVPIVNHLIDLMVKHEIRDIALLASSVHKEDFAKWNYLWSRDLPQANITIFFEDKPRGTFGGLGALRDWLGEESFILSNGDELKDFDLTSLVKFHHDQRSVATIALVAVPNAREYGVPVMEGNLIKKFLEKPENPPSDFISSGIYVLEPSVFKYADFSKDFLMIEKDIFPRLAAAGKLAGLKMYGRWYDCGNLERWEMAIKEW